jgi:hypothetical protein
MKKKEKEEKARLGEYWRAENELRKKAEELARKEAHEKSLEYARQLKEQMRWIYIYSWIYRNRQIPV